MPGPLVFLDASQVLPGKAEQVKAAMKELAAFVEENEPRCIAYDVYFSRDGGHVTVVQVHPDSASMEHHMEVAAHLFPRFKGLLTMTRMEIYGEPSPGLLEQMRQKARMLGLADVEVHRLHAGFNRFRDA